MRHLAIAAGVACVMWGSPSVAQTTNANNYFDCTKPQRAIITDAFARSKRLALTAATAVGPTPVFERWFGKYTPLHGEAVRANLKAIVGAIRSGRVTTKCTTISRETCEADTYAYVYSDDPYLIYLCPNFFSMPKMSDFDAPNVDFDNGTRAGTIIHELSHFTVVAGTDDICYSRSECSDMAVRRAPDAIINADSYQYFAEDVTIFGVAGRPVMSTFDPNKP